MKRYTKVEKIANNMQHPKKAIKLWQVVVREQVIYQSVGKALCIWWCDRHCIKRENIKAVY